MKTYEEVKTQYEILNAAFDGALEAAVFGGASLDTLELARKRRDACAELLRLRLYQPLFVEEK